MQASDSNMRSETIHHWSAGINGRPSGYASGVPGLLILTMFSLLLMGGNIGCQKAAIREAVPTGVEVIELEDGRTEYRATARASDAAIASGSYVKKQNTSCGAARLLMENEYYSRGLGRTDYSQAEFFMIYEAEYCRVIIIR